MSTTESNLDKSSEKPVIKIGDAWQGEYSNHISGQKSCTSITAKSSDAPPVPKCLPSVEITDLATSRQNYIHDNAVNMYNQFGSPQDFNKLVAPGNTEVSRQQLDGIVKESDKGNNGDWSPAQMAAIRFMRDEYNRDISQHHHLNVQNLDQYAVRNGALDRPSAPLHVASEQSVSRHDNAANMWKQFGNEQSFAALAGPGNNDISRQQLDRIIKSPDFEQKWTPEQKSAIQFMNDDYNKNISQHHRLRLDTMASYASEQGVDLRDGPVREKRPVKPDPTDLDPKTKTSGKDDKPASTNEVDQVVRKIEQDEKRFKEDQIALKADIDNGQKLLDKRQKDDEPLRKELDKAKTLLQPSASDKSSKQADHPEHAAHTKHTHHAISTRDSVAKIAAQELQDRKEQDIETYGKKHNVSDQDAAKAWEKAFKQNLAYEEHLIRLYNHIKPQQTNREQRQARTILLD